MPKTATAKTEIAAVPAKKRTAGALSKPVKPSAELAAIVGHHALPRTDVVAKDLGLHPRARAAGPGRQAQHRRRRQAQGRPREGSRHDV